MGQTVYSKVRSQKYTQYTNLKTSVRKGFTRFGTFEVGRSVYLMRCDTKYGFEEYVKTI